MKMNPEIIGIEENTFKENKTGFYRPIVIVILTIVFTATDGAVLYDITSHAMQQNKYLGILIAVSMSLILNFLPLISGKYLHRAIYKTERYALTMMIVSIVAFCIMYGATIKLRYEYRDQYGSSNAVKIVNTAEITDIAEESESDEIDEAGKTKDSKALAVFWLFALEPLVTSLINFLLGYLSDNDLKRQLEIYKMTELRLSDILIECETELEMISTVDHEKLLAYDAERCGAVKAKIEAEGERLKAVARLKLAEYLKDSESVSRLTDMTR